jgi:predicted ATP-binding protein involved in virulence
MNIFNHFQHLKLSTCQETALEKLESFFDNNNQVFILKGYAGTGKTTILKGVVEYLNSKKKSFTLMAPTGRAAKVLRDKTTFGKTIHSSIYDFENLIAVNKESEDEAEHSFHYLFPIKKNGDETRSVAERKALIESFAKFVNELRKALDSNALLWKDAITKCNEWLDLAEQAVENVLKYYPADEYIKYQLERAVDYINEARGE